MKTSLTAKEECFLVFEHLRQLQLIERLDKSSVSIVTGAVVTFQNMYSSYLTKLKDVSSTQKKLKQLENNFGDLDRASVLEEGKQLLKQRSIGILRTKIEMTYYSMLKRTSAISKLAGIYIYYYHSEITRCCVLHLDWSEKYNYFVLQLN